jgi:phage tail sheath protein FI
MKMAIDYLHGIEIRKDASGIRSIQSVATSVIGLVGTTDNKSLKPEIPKAFFRRKDALDAIKGKGTLEKAVVGIYDQAGATLLIIRAKSSLVADVSAACEKLLQAESMTGFKPKILCAPGFTHQMPEVEPEPEVPEEPGLVAPS